MRHVRHAAAEHEDRDREAGDVLVVEGGHVARQTTPEAAQRDGLTVVDLSDDWLPYVFSEEPGKPQPLRPYLIDLANGRFRSGSKYSRAREDRFFEAFGIFPSLNYMRRRIADRKRHACHEHVKDGVLEELAAKMANFSPSALRTAKEVLDRGIDGPLYTGIDLERKAYAMLRATGDFAEGVKAFGEKRRPEFFA